MQGSPFVRNGITLLSGLDPIRRCERTADAVSVKDRTLYFCPSPLFGYGLSRFLSRLDTEAANSAVLCIENDKELYGLSLENIDPSITGNSKFRLTNIADAGSLCVFVREAWGARVFRRIETIRFTGGWQLNSELYESLCRTLSREIATDWSNALTLTKLGRLYIRNALENLSLIPHFSSIANLSFGSSPVLVLGAGPSLDKTLDALEIRLGETLRSNIRPFKIICVDTCLGSLKDRHINPDLVVTLESQHWNLRGFTGCKDWEVPMAIDLSALPQSARALSGKGFLFMTPWTQLRIFERLKEAGLLPAVVQPLGSVGLSAVELALRITSGNIILGGLDFSFTADKYYARSAPGHKNRLNTQTRLNGIINAAIYKSAFTAVSKSGFSVLSSPVMRNYRDLFEREFNGIPRLFDIKGSGLHLGLKTLSMDEAMSLLLKNVSISSQGGTEARRENQTLITDKLINFINEEKKRLIDLRDMLTGETAMEKVKLNSLLHECDYLWAHFPDYAAADRSPDLESRDAQSFLNRVRTEIDPMVRLLERK